jgi:hypothetical protein
VPLSFTGISLVSWLVQTVKTIESREVETTVLAVVVL